VRRPAALLALALALAAMAAGAAAQSAGRTPRPVVVASKPFGESYVLAEMFAQLLEARGFPVERRPGLGATEVAFGALRSGAVDVYPEYTGTGLLAVLGEEPVRDPREAFRRVAREFESRWGAHWLPPLGFENTYAIAVRRDTARRLGLRTLSDLARAGPGLRAGFTPDFIGREDGLPGLRRAYGFAPRDTRALAQARRLIRDTHDLHGYTPNAAGMSSVTSKEVGLPVKLMLRALKPGAAELQVRLTLYYCREDNTGTCRIKTLVWHAPVEVTADPAAPREVKLQGKVD